MFIIVLNTMDFAHDRSHLFSAIGYKAKLQASLVQWPTYNAVF